jgi:hypothetical protein
MVGLNIKARKIMEMRNKVRLDSNKRIEEISSIDAKPFIIYKGESI